MLYYTFRMAVESNSVKCVPQNRARQTKPLSILEYSDIKIRYIPKFWYAATFLAILIIKESVMTKIFCFIKYIQIIPPTGIFYFLEVGEPWGLKPLERPYVYIIDIPSPINVTNRAVTTVVI